VVEKGLFGSLKDVKGGAGLGLWVSCESCILILVQRLGCQVLRHLLRRGYRRGGSSNRLGGASPSFAEVVQGVAVKHSGQRGTELELHGLDLLLEAWCRGVEDGRMAMNCYENEEQPHGSKEEFLNPLCIHGGGELMKKMKPGRYRSWKKLLQWFWAALDRVFAFGSKWAGLGRKHKRVNRVGSKARVKIFLPAVGFLQQNRFLGLWVFL
jgi:hypothetical protein